MMMLNKGLSKFTRWMNSIRVQLRWGMGIILALVLLIGLIGYLSLRTIQVGLEQDLNQAIQLRELGLQIENHFLLARQSEANFFNRWQTIGFAAAKEQFVVVNQHHLRQARSHLDEVERLVTETTDETLKSMLSEIGQLRVAFDDYEVTFLATVDLIEQYSQINGVAPQAEINTTVFQEVMAEIIVLTETIPETSGESLTQIQVRLFTISNQSIWALMLITLLAVGLGIWGTALLLKQIIFPLSELNQVAQQFGQGKFAHRVTLTRPTEFVNLRDGFNVMADQLQTRVSSLAQRNQRLRLVAQINERLSVILDVPSLLRELVVQVKDQFHYDQVHIYLFDDQRDYLVIAEGTSLTDAEIKTANHRIAVNTATSAVARAARSGEIIQLDNVREPPDWLPDDLLPDTYAEMAVPMIVDNEVVGVLNVQEDKVAEFDEGDESLLRSLANQVAVAIRNARLFTEVGTALEQANEIQAKYIEQAWDKTQGQPQYHYQRSGTTVLNENALEYLHQLAQEQSAEITAASQVQEIAEDDYTALIAPIKLQNQIIGTMQLYETDDTQQRQWTDLEKNLIQAISSQVAQTAENLRLFEQTRQQASREQILRQITEKMRASTSLEQLIRTTTEELSQHFSAEYAMVDLAIQADADLKTNHQGS